MSQPPAPARDAASRYRRVRFAFALVGLAVLVAGMAYLGAIGGALAAVALFGGPPLLGYVFGVRSMAGSVLTGLAMLAVITGTTLYVIDESASSTAALGYLTLPLVGIPLVVVAILLDRAIRSTSGSVLAGLTVLAVTIGTMVYILQESAADSFCDHANGLGNTMAETGHGPLTASGAERLAALQSDLLTDGRVLREEGLTESAHVAEVWARALADVRDADSQAERNAAYNHLRRVVYDLYGSTGTCSNLR